ncbi:GntR family transcriptional regulator [Citricoccus sp. NPDC055426]|uniref:GntR family transcriptional regulator n=1 Tax=Citricoccus sp. NPDC055426 TaxID=3155536 RepID=UPI0034212EF5
MPINTPTKRDVIIGELRSLIVSGELARGSHLPQDDLAKRFRSSITPVREALRALEVEGLVVSEARRGVRVAGVDFERVKATYVVRRLTESYAIRRATIRFSPHDIRRGEELLEELNQAARLSGAERLRELNKKYHFFFYERCGIPGLVNEIDTLWRAFPWDLLLSSNDSMQHSEREHCAILEAVRSGHPDAAAEAMGKHLERSFSVLTTRLTGRPANDPFDIHND